MIETTARRHTQRARARRVRVGWAAVLLLAGCASTPKKPAGSDTDLADTDVAAVDTNDVAPANQVLTVFHVSPRDEGADFNGDGAADNAIWPLASALDGVLAQRLAGNVHVLVEQLGDVDDWSDDASVTVALFPAVDLDNNGADNTSGAEAFDAEGFVDADGVALAQAPGVLVGGRYTATLPPGDFQVGSIVFAVATNIVLSGQVTASGQTGRVSLGVTKPAIESALTAENLDSGTIALLTGLADLDLDQDGTLDAVSMSFDFEATACGLVDPAADTDR